MKPSSASQDEASEKASNCEQTVELDSFRGTQVLLKINKKWHLAVTDIPQ